MLSDIQENHPYILGGIECVLIVEQFDNVRPDLGPVGTGGPEPEEGEGDGPGARRGGGAAGDELELVGVAVGLGVRGHRAEPHSPHADGGARCHGEHGGGIVDVGPAELRQIEVPFATPLISRDSRLFCFPPSLFSLLCVKECVVHNRLGGHKVSFMGCCSKCAGSGRRQAHVQAKFPRWGHRVKVYLKIYLTTSAESCIFTERIDRDSHNLELSLCLE